MRPPAELPEPEPTVYPCVCGGDWHTAAGILHRHMPELEPPPCPGNVAVTASAVLAGVIAGHIPADPSGAALPRWRDVLDYSTICPRVCGEPVVPGGLLLAVGLVRILGPCSCCHQVVNYDKWDRPDDGKSAEQKR